jgi:hypothetical protein
MNFLIIHKLETYNCVNYSTFLKSYIHTTPIADSALSDRLSVVGLGSHDLRSSTLLVEQDGLHGGRGGVSIARSLGGTLMAPLYESGNLVGMKVRRLSKTGVGSAEPK